MYRFKQGAFRQPRSWSTRPLTRVVLESPNRECSVGRLLDEKSNRWRLFDWPSCCCHPCTLSHGLLSIYSKVGRLNKSGCRCFVIVDEDVTPQNIMNFPQLYQYLQRVRCDSIVYSYLFVELFLLELVLPVMRRSKLVRRNKMWPFLWQPKGRAQKSTSTPHELVLVNSAFAH